MGNKKETVNEDVRVTRQRMIDDMEFRAEMREIAKQFSSRQWTCIGYIAAMIIGGTLLTFMFSEE